MDLGYGPLSNTPFTLRREAAVYRALQGSAVRVPKLLAVHPTQEAFLMQRIEGHNWFSEINDPEREVAIASDFMRQISALHNIDPSTLDLPGFDPAKPVSAYVRDEINIWERVHLDGAAEREPLVMMAAAWLRRHLPDDTGTAVFVQGDTGPGNFMYRDDRVAVVLDWENAHFGDFHDDLAWIYVRDLQERFTSLPERLADYERQSGHEVDVGRLRYFIVLAQMRCAIGTLNALSMQDARGEMANHLIYSALHLRMLAEALASANEIELPNTAVTADEPSSTAWTWLYDVALQELRDVIVPSLVNDAFANRRAKGLARMLKVLEANDRLGTILEEAELADLRKLLNRAVKDSREGRSLLCEAISTGALDESEGIRYLRDR
jgi:aminoglycoside phosphotransferase (APT) family kinase protein